MLIYIVYAFKRIAEYPSFLLLKIFKDHQTFISRLMPVLVFGWAIHGSTRVSLSLTVCELRTHFFVSSQYANLDLIISL